MSDHVEEDVLDVIVRGRQRRDAEIAELKEQVAWLNDRLDSVKKWISLYDDRDEFTFQRGSSIFDAIIGGRGFTLTDFKQRHK